MENMKNGNLNEEQKAILSIEKAYNSINFDESQPKKEIKDKDLLTERLALKKNLKKWESDLKLDKIKKLKSSSMAEIKPITKNPVTAMVLRERFTREKIINKMDKEMNSFIDFFDKFR